MYDLKLFFRVAQVVVLSRSVFNRNQHFFCMSNFYVPKIKRFNAESRSEKIFMVLLWCFLCIMGHYVYNMHVAFGLFQTKFVEPYASLFLVVFCLAEVGLLLLYLYKRMNDWQLVILVFVFYGYAKLTYLGYMTLIYEGYVCSGCLKR